MAWIMKIAKNLYISKIRREKGIIRVDYEEAEMIPFENITTLEDRLLLETSFRVLNSDERNVVILHVMQDLKFREISSILDKPLGSVLSLYHRALKKLKKGLSEK